MQKLNLIFRIKKSIAHRYLRGFTLIEAMMGIFIISVSIGGPMVIAGRAAQEIRYSRELFAATFLGQEAIELIRYRRDSVFLECSDPSSSMCLNASSTIPTNPLVQELPNETAWKVFKNQFGGANGNFCFSAAGCVFDIYGLLKNPTVDGIPTDLYDATSVNCNSFYQDRSTQINNSTATSSTDFMYLCNNHAASRGVDTQTRRVVKMTSMTSATCPSYECSYNDNIKVDVTVFYNYRGTQKSLMVTDFIKPRS